MLSLLRAVVIATLLVAFSPVGARPILRPAVRPSVAVTLPAPPVALVRALEQEPGALAPGATTALATRLGRAALGVMTRTRRPLDLGAWAPAVAALAGGGPAHGVVARALVQDLYERLHARPDWAAVQRIAPLAALPAHAFHLDYPDAVLAPSPNYWPTKLHHDRLIRYVVIHDTEAPCAAALNWFLNPNGDASAHFLVCRDGRIYQLVRVADAAWHAGNPYINRHSIGIEHEGYAGGPYTRAQYEATASILRWVDARQHLGLQWTRNAVMGHENVPGSDHTDPGPGWDWPLFMALLRGGAPYVGGDARLAIVLRPQIYVRTCASAACSYLGTANWGEQFSVRARLDNWLQIDYGGARGWIDAAATGHGQGTVVRITARRSSIVRAAPAASGNVVGRLAIGQAYASTLVDDVLDRKGWWLIEYAHRYGFICACGTVPGFHPTPRPTATATVTATGTPTATPWPTRTPTPTRTSAPTRTRTPRPTRTPTPRPRATKTPTATATATAMATAMATASPTGTASATATATASATPTLSPTPALSPSPKTPSPTPPNGAMPTPTPAQDICGRFAC